MATQVRNSRILRDAGLVITKALPNNTSSTTDTIDLGSGPFNPEEVVVEISVPAIAAHTTANNLTITLWHADTTTVAAMTAPQPVIECDVLGVVSTGSVATLFRYKLPPGTKRYIGWRLTATTDDCSAGTATFSILV